MSQIKDQVVWVIGKVWSGHEIGRLRSLRSFFHYLIVKDGPFKL